MMFKDTNGLTAAYLTDSIVMASEAHDRNTWLTNSYDVHVPSHNSEILKRSFVYNGSVLWNSIRHEVKLPDNIKRIEVLQYTEKRILCFYAFHFIMLHVLFYHDL